MSSCVGDGEQENDKGILQIQLPLTFQVYSTNRGIPPHNISIIHQLENVSLDRIRIRRLGEDDDNGCPRVVQVKSDIHMLLLKSGARFFYGTFRRYENDSETKTIMIHNHRKEYYQVIYLENFIKLEELSYDSKMKIQTISNKSDLISKCSIKIDKSDIRNDEEVDLFISKFSMLPPLLSETTSTSKLASTHSQDDPLTFLLSRYLLTLYALGTPLTYFPKTSLSRFRILAANHQEIIVNTLGKLLLSTEEMESRHQGKYGILTNHFVEESTQSLNHFDMELEKENQKHFVAKNSTLIETMKNFDKNPVIRELSKDSIESINSKNMSTITEDKFANLVLRLKIREAQLQLIIIFELLCSRKISENEFLERNLKASAKELERKDREAKRSLIRNRKKPRKIIPTFLGTGLLMEEDKTIIKTSKKMDDYSLYKSLNALVDWLNVWDTLLGGNLSDDNAYQFLKYVLIPYFSSRLPVILKYVVEKVKDLNMKFSTISKSKTVIENKKELSKVSNLNGGTENIISKQLDVKRSSKYNKVHLKRKRPTLVKSATMGVLDNNDLLPALSIKRSNSNLSSKNLQRRQVDMSTSSRKSNSIKPVRSKSLTENSAESMESLIFGNATKTKVASLKEVTLPAKQVESTPMKSQSESILQSNIILIDSPFGVSTINNLKSTSQVLATPRHKKQIHQEVLQTPAGQIGFQENTYRSSEKESLTDKLLAASLLPPQADSKITSSPGLKSVIDSSPINLFIRSNSVKRKRPGDPIDEESPFYGKYLQEQPSESPISKERRQCSPVKEHRPQF